MNEKILTDKIVSDAKRKAASLVKEAEISATELIETTKREIEQKRQEALEKAEAEAALLIKNRNTIAGLEAKKDELKERRKRIDAAYVLAKRNLMIRAGDDYRLMIKKLLKRHAESGDIVILGQSDFKKIDKAFIDKVASEMKIELILSDRAGEFDGGFKLVNSSCDKNLSFDGLIAELRREIETEVVKIIFSRN